mmetsp:Transcript_107778/g.190637  ORF Transcript_107778/g.190637 Transcript_107778/m.190637 type:complete len:80 (-) Transcript_107778:141-380(-)
MGVQQELSEANRGRKENLVIRDEEGPEGSLLAEAADSLSAAFDAIDGTVAQSMQDVASFFGAGEDTQDVVATTPPKKVV